MSHRLSMCLFFFFFSSRRRHTRFDCDWSSDVCSSDLIRQWAASDRELVKRAAFAMIAGLAVHDKAAAAAQFAPFLRRIRRASTDNRNFVKKAVNWALLSIGKRTRRINLHASSASMLIG